MGQTRTCDGCGARGVVCATVDGEVLTAGGSLELHPALGAELGLDVISGRGLVVLLPGRADGSDAHHTYCEDCASEPRSIASRNRAALRDDS